MIKTKFSILGISGSLRQSSVNTTFLRAMRLLCPSEFSFEIYPGLHQIPLFNPDIDDSGEIPEAVSCWRTSLLNANMILLVSPEYAHGVTGVIKNALDWIVSSGELTDKPLAFPNLSVRTDLAWQQLAETLKVMGCQLIDECSPHASLSTPLILPDMSEQQIIDNLEIVSQYHSLWFRIAGHLQATTMKS